MQRTALSSEADKAEERNKTPLAAPATDFGSQSQIEDLQRRESALHAIFDANAHAMLVYNARGEVVSANKAAMSMFEYSPADLPLGMPYQAQLFRMLGEDGLPLSPGASPILRALHGDTISGVLAILERRDGSRRWLSISAAPLRAGNLLSGVVASFADVSAQQEAREQKEDLLRAVSHDLRNPLAALRLHARVLASELKVIEDNGSMQEHAHAVLACSDSMEAMIKSMVDAARLESGQLQLRFEVFELRAFIASVLYQQGAGLSSDRIHIAPGEDILVRADEHCVERILVNLLSNASKYSAPGTEISVSFARQPGAVVVSVKDYGRGIAPDDLRCLFRRYFRAASCGEETGLGLGLYITQMLVGAQGGHIWAESVLGEGSTFSFTLPAYQQ